jgi:hypothetical protein
MSVWEIRNFLMNTVAWVGPASETEFVPDFGVSFWQLFDNKTPGQPLEWSARPELVAFAPEGRKKLPPRADVSPFTAAGLVVNEKVRTSLGDFLTQFGQLLEINVDGKTEYYYNVTNVVPCIDTERSEIAAGFVEVPVFQEQLVPVEPSIFIEPVIHARIFVNDAAKLILEERIAANKIRGMDFKSWGSSNDKKVA